MRQIRKDNTHRPIKLAILWLAVLVLLFSLSRLLYFSNQLNKVPFTNIKNNILYISGNDICLISLDKENSWFYRFDGKTEVEVTGGLGRYRTDKVIYLGKDQLDGLELFRKTAMMADSYPIQGVVLDKNKSRFTKPGWNFFSWEKNVESPYSFYELFVIWRKLREENIREVESITKEMIRDRAIFREGMAIEVVNSTDRLGLAGWFGGILESAGARVIGFRNGTKNTETECLVEYAVEKQDTYTIKWLSTYFPDCSYYHGNKENNRVDIVITLGENYWQKYHR